MPSVDKSVRDQLVLHQFIAGLPQDIARQLRATGDTKELDATVDKARLLLTLDSHNSYVATIAEDPSSNPLVHELKTQVDALTQQVAALTPVSPQSQGHYQAMCGGIGHLKYECPSRNRQPFSSARNVRCFKCGQWGHIKDCKEQGNSQRVPARGGSHPGRR